jgi:hypothetical protein
MIKTLPINVSEVNTKNISSSLHGGHKGDLLNIIIPSWFNNSKELEKWRQGFLAALKEKEAQCKANYKQVVCIPER